MHILHMGMKIFVVKECNWSWLQVGDSICSFFVGCGWSWWIGSTKVQGSKLWIICIFNYALLVISFHGWSGSQLCLVTRPTPSSRSWKPLLTPSCKIFWTSRKKNKRFCHETPCPNCNTTKSPSVILRKTRFFKQNSDSRLK